MALARHLNCQYAPFLDLLDRLLEVDPARRLTPVQALCHPFLQPLVPLALLFPPATGSIVSPGVPTRVYPMLWSGATGSNAPTLGQLTSPSSSQSLASHVVSPSPVRVRRPPSPALPAAGAVVSASLLAKRDASAGPANAGPGRDAKRRPSARPVAAAAATRTAVAAPIAPPPLELTPTPTSTAQAPSPSPPLAKAVPVVQWPSPPPPPASSGVPATKAVAMKAVPAWNEGQYADLLVVDDVEDADEDVPWPAGPPPHVAGALPVAPLAPSAPAAVVVQSPLPSSPSSPVAPVAPMAPPAPPAPSAPSAPAAPAVLPDSRLAWQPDPALKRPRPMLGLLPDAVKAQLDTFSLLIVDDADDDVE